MKKFILCATVVVFLFGLAACGGGGKYADAKKLMEKQVQLFEDFANALDKAGSADDVVAALNNFSDGMKEMVPQMKELQEKYPELKDAKDEAMPEELKPIMEKLQNEVMPKFMGAMMKIQQYASDPAVQEASQKFQQAMSEMK
jgi:predicted transcriptional regulator